MNDAERARRPLRPQRQHPETLAAQAAGYVEPLTGAIVPSIQPATTFVRGRDYQAPSPTDYIRTRNPSGAPAEELLARLEGGAEAFLFSSGMAAVNAVVMALRPGDHIVLQKSLYYGVRNWILSFAQDWGLSVTLVESDDEAAFQAALQPGTTKLVWIETPSNPLWNLVDIAGLAALAREAGARLAVDNTVATPLLTQPLALGADIVMHSATKYLNGHSDVLAGALVTARKDSFWARIQSYRQQAGPVLGSFEAWLLLRGMRTLPLRVSRQCETAAFLAARFNGHPALDGVLYPGLPEHPGHAIARRQMKGGFGAMLSLLIRKGETAAIEVAGSCRLFLPATSLGGVESLIEHRATVEGPESPVPRHLLRLSIGLEHAEDLAADLEEALHAAA